MKRQLIYHTHVCTNQTHNISVDVRTDTTEATCYLNRVSRDGLTLSCDADTLRELMPNKASVAPKDPIAINTYFSLPQKIEAKCRVIFARRLSKNQFLMELKFVEVSEQTMLHLENYIEKTLHTLLNCSEDRKVIPQQATKANDSEIYQINSDLRFTFSKVA